jgi:hypothetical protein
VFEYDFSNQRRDPKFETRIPIKHSSLYTYLLPVPCIISNTPLVIPAFGVVHRSRPPWHLDKRGLPSRSTNTTSRVPRLAYCIYRPCPPLFQRHLHHQIWVTTHIHQPRQSRLCLGLESPRETLVLTRCSLAQSLLDVSSPSPALLFCRQTHLLGTKKMHPASFALYQHSSFHTACAWSSSPAQIYAREVSL